MTSDKYVIGRGTKIYVAPLLQCQRSLVPHLNIVTSAAVQAGATTIPVTITNLGYITDAAAVTPTPTPTPSPAPAAGAATAPLMTAPFYLNFVEATGRHHFIIVTTDLLPGATSLTVDPSTIKRSISAGALAIFPVVLQNRNNANLTNNDNQVEINTFDNDGYMDQITTRLGNGLEAGGYYSPLDAGWNTCRGARDGFGEIYWELHLPKPGCTDDYTRGHVFYGFGGVTNIPIETPSDNIINSPITISARGPVGKLNPV